MPVPTSSISLSSIQTEFGGSNPISMSEYYAGAATGFVPAGTSGIPSSGAINIGAFSGKSKSQLVALVNHTVYAERNAVGQALYNQSSALSRITFSTDGKIYGLGSTSWGQFASATGSITLDGTEYFSDTQAGSTSGNQPLQNWLIGGGASNYSVRFRATQPGNADGYRRIRSGTFDTWLPMTESREFTVVAYSGGSYGASNSIGVIGGYDVALTSNTSNILYQAGFTIFAIASSSDQQNLE